MVARSFGANDRIAYTAVGLFLIYIWLFDFSVGLLEKIFGEANGDIEMFFLSGVMITIAATFIVVYNAELVLLPLMRLGSFLGRLLPSLKMAVAYPLANKMRTGMTLAMFCLVVFALTVMSSMNYNFERLYLSDRSLGGWDIVVEEHPTNPIGDLEAQLAAAGSPAAAEIDQVGVSSLTASRRGRICQNDVPSRDCSDLARYRDSYSNYTVRGESAGFFSAADISLQARAGGYANDEAVWNAVAGDPSLGVIDSFALSGDFGSSPVLSGIEPTAKDFEPVTVTLYDPDSGNTQVMKVIGIIEMGASNNFSGLHVSQAAFGAVYGQPDLRYYYVKTLDGADNVQTARNIESALLTTGAQADSMRKLADDQNATQRGFFLLLQGFMGLGLFVGVAAVGVIAFRTVVERRQQIGMLRALGYTRGMVGLTFLIESAFIAFMGVVSGIVFAVILARQLITDEFANQGVTTFAVPWSQLGLIGGLAFGFALLMTLIPSRQAASIPIAQALRYE
jgi:putative ABC transport system permease protein